MYFKFKSFFKFLWVVIFFNGCSSSPSNQEVISTISKNVEQDLPCYEARNVDVEVDKIGYKQSSNSNDWFPVRIKATGKCLPKYEDEDSIPLYASLERTDEEFEEIAVDTSFTVEYKFQRNEYGEWEAKLMN